MFKGASFGEREGISTVELTITPETAAAMLTTNAMNRPISRAHVERLSGAMQRGEWELNGSTIKVASNGRLLDGQHRLAACVESGKPFRTLVVRGLPESAFGTIDQIARPRSVSDVLSMEFGGSMFAVSAALACLNQIRTMGEIVCAGSKSMGGFSASVAREMLLKHPGIIESVSVSNSIPIFRNAQCAALHYLFGIVDCDLAGEFAEVMRSGSANLRRPFHIFREGLIRIRSTSAIPNKRDASARAIKAFNAERIGKSVSVLVWRANEEFPRIDGLDYNAI